jgi:hypothetical protein
VSGIGGVTEEHGKEAAIGEGEGLELVVGGVIELEGLVSGHHEHVEHAKHKRPRCREPEPEAEAGARLTQAI